MVVLTNDWIYKGVHHRFTYFDADSFDEFSPITQAYAICFTPDGKVVLGFNEAIFEYWNLPGGTVEKGETPLETLHREVDEEVSISLEKIKLLGIQKVEYPNGEQKTHYQLRFVALVKELKPLTIDPDTNTLWERKLIDPADFIKYITWGSVGEHLIKRAENIFFDWKNKL